MAIFDDNGVVISMTKLKYTDEPQMIKLRKILYKIGGNNDDINYDIDVDIVLSRGKLFDNKRMYNLGIDHRCHKNSANLWSGNKNILSICTGYALYDDIWYTHSWCINKKTNILIETCNVSFEKYYGYILTKKEAIQFVVDNPSEFQMTLKESEF